MKSEMPMLTRIAMGALFLSIQAACIEPAQAQTDNGSDIPVCGADVSPYRDLDFLVGEWEFFLEDGTKIAEQTYLKREAGCLILEDWRTVTGETGTGMNFVDPATGRWRQVWMSPNFQSIIRAQSMRKEFLPSKAGCIRTTAIQVHKFVVSIHPLKTDPSLKSS